MPRNYVDNAMNRSLGRVGMPVGSAVHSRGSSSGYGGSSSSSYGSYVPKTYADNSMNRGLGRVGMEHGTAVHSSNSSSNYGSYAPKTYADNSMNRGLGRVGMEHGTAVHSRSNTSSSYLECAMHLSSGMGGMAAGSAVHRSSSISHYGSSNSAGSFKTYADNPMNRQLGRVGMEHGTAVHSKSKNSDYEVSHRSSPAFGFSVTRSSHSSDSGNSNSAGSFKTYADNPMNRQLGRVGMEHGTAVHSKSKNSDYEVSHRSSPALGFSVTRSSHSSDSGNSSSRSETPTTYVDNAMNRRLDRVGLEHGSVAHSRSEEDSGVSWSSQRANSTTGSSVGSAYHKSREASDSDKSSAKRYVDNVLNRKLGRVGMVHGTAVQSRYADSDVNKNKGDYGTSVMSKKSPSKKVYVDNPYNRRLNRVGLPLGSAPICTPSQKEARRKVPTMKTVDRYGETRHPPIVIENKLAVLFRHLEHHYHEELPAELDNLPEEAVTCVLDFKQREMEIEKYLEESAEANWKPHEHTAKATIRKYQGAVIDFEKLQMGKKIGAGGFGDVYFATLDGQAVAVKKLKFQQVTKKRLHLFQNEMDVFIRLDHPNIVTFLGACVATPNLAIVMELMDMSLFDAIHIKQVLFTVEDKLEIIKGVTGGMAYIHNQDIAHCDLKTQNILLINVPGKSTSTDSVPVLAKITDFGLSRMKSDVSTSTSIPSTRYWSPRYAAPEKHQGKILTLDQQKKADVFSLGLLIWELAVEEIPFEDLEPEQLKVQVGTKGLTPVAPEYARLDRRLQKYLTLCWSMDPDKRPRADTVAAIGRGLTNLLEAGEE